LENIKVTTFLTADIPADITTIEQLNTWTTEILAFNNPTDSYVEAANTNRLYRFFSFLTRIPSAEKTRINRVALTVDETLEVEGQPSWIAVKEYSNSSIPASFKVDHSA
jgi:hypothetical protein